MTANKSLRRTPDAFVTRLAFATRAPAAGAAELESSVALIKGITFSFVLLIGVAFLTPSFASEDELLIKEFRVSLAKNISAAMARQFRSDLK